MSLLSPSPLPSEPPHGPRPPWLEFDQVDLTFLPAEAYRMIGLIIEPAWRDLVLRARGPVERAVGLSMVHLLWLEILIQVGQMRNYRGGEMVIGLMVDTAGIEHTLKLITAKTKLVNACIRLEEFRLANGRGVFEPEAERTCPCEAAASPAAVPEQSASEYLGGRPQPAPPNRRTLPAPPAAHENPPFSPARTQQPAYVTKP